jgi:hypothetical protein
MVEEGIDVPEGYSMEKRTIDLVRANVYGVAILVPITLVFGLPYYLVWGNPFAPERLRALAASMPGSSPIILMLAVVAMLVLGIVLHELIHGLTWSIFTRNGFRSVKFGILKEMLTPYCHCKEPLKVKHYILGALMPAVVLGAIPAIAAILVGSVGLLAFGIFFTMAACGDFLIVNLLRKESRNSLVLDHPSEAGCYIFKKVEP